MSRNEKLVIIGLDGGTFRVLCPLAESGTMPMLGRMLREGAFGNLMTTRPPVKCPAWPTMWTGVNPGKHGVFSFSFRDPKTREVRTASANDVHAPRLWDIAGDDGKQVGVFNVPITFPATRVNGDMLTGFVSPEDSPQVFWPSAFGEEMRAKFPDLSLTWGVLGHRPSDTARREAHIRMINELMALRCRQFEWAANRADYDFCFLVHEYTDRVGHLFYHLLDAEFGDFRRASNVGSRRLLEDGHRILDDSIARRVSRFGDRANYMLVSDHGFDGVDALGLHQQFS
ncbi:MAG: alkaline phosphatase family protein [Planctomycetes bacterium]|nr:alkaline phosphatase family protein [Planctomycetota bacterium]MBI3833263.1 alkaline phosphatase family protein [Planctomycetota bacterium]